MLILVRLTSEWMVFGSSPHFYASVSPSAKWEKSCLPHVTGTVLRKIKWNNKWKLLFEVERPHTVRLI